MAGISSKIFIGLGLTFVAIVGLLFAFSLDDTGSLSAEEINQLERQQSGFDYNSSFSGIENLEFLSKWCTENKGTWSQISVIGKGECGFETKTQWLVATSNLEDLQSPKITGYAAEQICDFLVMDCPNRVSFNGWYQVNTGKTIVNYEFKNMEFRFDVTDENNITYKRGDSEASFNLSDAPLFADYSLSVKTGYDFYELGDKIAISGRVHDNIHMLSQAEFDYPVLLQIIMDKTLIEIAQLDPREDGEFHHIIKTGGYAWKEGHYEVLVTYDDVKARTVFDMI